jgi:hypothetical protein
MGQKGRKHGSASPEILFFNIRDIVHALQDKNKLNQRMDIPGNIYTDIERANALDCAENGASRRRRGAEWEAKQT